MEPIGVVHLARAKNGLKPFASFLRSYLRYRAGVPHDLLIVYKGFHDEKEIGPWEQAMAGLKHQKVLVSDFGFDLRAFRLAVEHWEYKHLFFLNSFSEILAEDWLAKPLRLFQTNDAVGIVGATGSWESMYSNASSDLNQCRGLIGRLLGQGRVAACKLFFDPFPNSHLRTNAFMMPRQLMLRLWPRQIWTKRGAYLFENGKRGLTKRILSAGLIPLVVGKDGIGYERQHWARSHTFRSRNQENLLISDNQTKLYEGADEDRRVKLASLAWGPNLVKS